jgi:hypothetical protein
MINLKCWWFGHKLYKVGRSKRGLTIERFVECKCCGKVIIMITIHPRYGYIYEGIPYDKLPPILYFERKRLKRQRIMKFKSTNGEHNDSPFNKPVNP